MGTSRGSSPDKLLINLENASSFLSRVFRSMCVDRGRPWLGRQCPVVLVDNFVNGPRLRHRAATRLPYSGPLFEEVPASLSGSTSLPSGRPSVSEPKPGPPSPRADSDIQAHLSSPGSPWDELNELPIRVVSTLLVQGRLRRPGADYGVGGLTENRANAAGKNDDRVSREVLTPCCADSSANAAAKRSSRRGTAERNSQLSYFLLASDSKRRTCSSSALAQLCRWSPGKSRRGNSVTGARSPKDRGHALRCAD